MFTSVKSGLFNFKIGRCSGDRGSVLIKFRKAALTRSSKKSVRIIEVYNLGGFTVLA